MTASQGQLDISALAGLEQQLASTLTTTAQQVARLEELDQEQRAEIYSILSAIQQDAAVHEALIEAMAKTPSRWAAPSSA